MAQVGTRWITLVVVALPMLFGGCGGPSTTDSAGESEIAIEDQLESIPVNESSAIDVEGTARAIWWNQDRFVESLGLDEDQRRRMDGVLAEFLAGWPESVQTRRKTSKELMEALSNGDFAEAEAVAERHGEAARYLEAGMVQLKARVVAELTPEQRATMLQKHRRMLLRRWVSPGRVNAGERQEP